MWIHEAFTMYSESVFVECQYGKEKAEEYLNGMRKNVKNDKPIIGPFGVNKEGSGDMYCKGALMLNSIRNVINDDFKWWRILYKYCDNFRHKIVDSKTVIEYFATQSGIDLTAIFNQYLMYKNIPILDLRITKKRLEYKWICDESKFNMPIDIKFNNKIIRLNPTNSYQTSEFKVKKKKEIEVLTDKFFINVIKN